MVIPRRTDRPRLHALLHAVRPGAAAQVEDAGDAVVEEQLPLVPVVVNVRVDQARNDVLSSRIDHGDSGRYRGYRPIILLKLECNTCLARSVAKYLKSTFDRHAPHASLLLID